MRRALDVDTKLRLLSLRVALVGVEVEIARELE
jgi:hypothetical protein